MLPTLKARIRDAHLRTVVSINRELILLYMEDGPRHFAPAVDGGVGHRYHRTPCHHQLEADLARCRQHLQQSLQQGMRIGICLSRLQTLGPYLAPGKIKHVLS
ncbi:MAG: hypothetical protein ACYCT1_17470 [Steroidobacteraceae bacterium]